MTIAWGKFLFYSKIMLLLRNVKMNLKSRKTLLYLLYGMVWYGMVWYGMGVAILKNVNTLYIHKTYLKFVNRFNKKLTTI